MKNYNDELPNNDVDYPAYMDSADVYLASQAHKKSMQELEQRLLSQVREKGRTNCGHTSEASIKKTFARFH